MNGLLISLSRRAAALLNNFICGYNIIGKSAQGRAIFFGEQEAMYDDNHEAINEDEVIDDFLGEQPRARELRLMRLALQERRNAFARDRARSKDEREQALLSAKLTELDKQIAAIRQEEAITTFVEDSVRVTLHKPSLAELEEED